MSAYLDAMRSYATFHGQTSHQAFLAAQIVFLPLVALSFGVFGLPFLVDGTGMGSRSIWPIALFLFIVLPHAVPWAALMVRRLHDTDRTGACALLALLPFGIVVPFSLAGLVIWGRRPGTTLCRDRAAGAAPGERRAVGHRVRGDEGAGARTG